ncbi:MULTISPECIES: S8 family serine peptidase [Clostridia]|uniref:S8 family serine peptidase n=1 Tax=Clostridia TaxID=186801 RepID=UPI000EA0256D|nr:MULTISPECIES: S8 family serine peptidase [Clostridia]NBJ71687.1 hypothetical protein [Roseburia sp. 1XD42-34]RKI73821.1 hypothetical protein D7V87_19905 [Clostridium sp. 1xD42-85]
MSDKNLPIKIVMQKRTDIKKNQGGGNLKFFGEVTPQLQNQLIKKFQNVLDFYKDVFIENEHVPAVGKIVVKSDAIAKSHKPIDLCRNCPIIGSEDLNEIYIKVTEPSIKSTMNLINKPTSQKIKANLTTIQDIQPIRIEEKISKELKRIYQVNTKEFDDIKTKIKVKIFDFNDEYDNEQIKNYIHFKLNSLGLASNYNFVRYGDNIEYLKMSVNSTEDIINIARINGVKSVDFFQQYSLPINEQTSSVLNFINDSNAVNSDTIIGIIDGGISLDNPYLSPYVIKREEYVEKEYQNPTHATFIASTIQYGNQLNGFKVDSPKKFKFVDVVAIPNSDKSFGLTDSIGEEELMEIIEDVMNNYSKEVKIWNLSLGIESLVCNGTMSDLGIFLDYIQDEYEVQIFVSSGNYTKKPYRNWPPQGGIGNQDRIIAPADSVRAITVGSLALYESNNSIVKRSEPSPFSRRGPGANYIVKPDVVDFGGNIDQNSSIVNLGMKGLDIAGNVVEGIGTSYSNPRIVQKYASVFDEMLEKDLLLAKAMVIHSARMNSRSYLDENQNNIKYFGFGMPPADTNEIINCSKSEITLVFRQKIIQGSYLELFDFPFPPSLIRSDKYYGEIGMTLVYSPVLDQRYGSEYCRTNIDVSFGTYVQDDGKIDFKGQVPLESAWDEKFEKSRVENGFKWSPVKSYYRNISRGIKVKDGWKIRIDMTPRSDIIAHEQEFVLIITIKDSFNHDIYSEVVTGLREKGYITNNLETKQQVRFRQ